MDNALPWRSIDPVSYRVSGNLEKIIPELRQLSKNRIANSDFFQKVNEDVQEYLTNIKPLEYTSILKMQQDDQRRNDQRDQELANATEKEVEDVSAETDHADDKMVIVRDEYMNESLAILADYIKLLRRTE